MKRILSILLIIIGVTGFFVGSKIMNQKPEGNTYDKCITIIVTTDQELINDEFCTNQEYLGDVIDEYSDTFDSSFRGKITDPYGRVLETLLGYTIQSNEFFFIYVDDVYGKYGVDQQVIEDGVTYEFRLGTY